MLLQAEGDYYNRVLSWEERGEFKRQLVKKQLEIPAEKCRRLFKNLQRLDQFIDDEDTDMNEDRAYEEFLEIMFSCSEVQNEFEIMTIYEPNFVPYNKMESFYNNQV